jgi:hypothetical protein
MDPDLLELSGVIFRDAVFPLGVGRRREDRLAVVFLWAEELRRVEESRLERLPADVFELSAVGAATVLPPASDTRRRVMATAAPTRARPKGVFAIAATAPLPILAMSLTKLPVPLTTLARSLTGDLTTVSFRHPVLLQSFLP